MILPGEIKTISELIAYLQQVLSMNPQGMTLKEQEDLAADIVGLAVNDKFDEWAREYPAIRNIFDIALDLEWSNVGGTEEAAEGWRAIGMLVDELTKQVAQPTDVHTVQQFIEYCQGVLAGHPEQMSDSEQVNSAGALTVLLANDEYHGQWQSYPQIIEILDVAADLDWLNTDTTKGDWNRIRELTNELEQQLARQAQ